MSRAAQAWIGVALILIACTFNMLSDVLLRLHNNPALLKANDVVPGSWDVLCAGIGIVGMFLVVAAYLNWRP